MCINIVFVNNKVKFVRNSHLIKESSKDERIQFCHFHHWWFFLSKEPNQGNSQYHKIDASKISQLMKEVYVTSYMTNSF